MINLMLQGRQPIIYGDGTQMRCFSFVHDILPLFEQLVDSTDVVGQVINFGPDEEFVTINELAVIIADLLNFDLAPVFMPGRPQEVRLANCSADKARQMLGYQTSYSLRQGLAEMIDYIRNRGVKKFKYHLDLEIINDKTPVTWKERLF
jgi:UDP-glucose 4-epimerase